MVDRAREILNQLDNVISQFGLDNTDFKIRATTLREEIEEAIEAHRSEALPRKTEQALGLFQEVLTSKDEFWVYLFQHAKEQQLKMSDRQMASRLIGQGEACLQRGDSQQLQQVVSQLMGLLPREIQEAVRQGGYAQGVVLMGSG
jgi:hypothetical protein